MVAERKNKRPHINQCNNRGDEEGLFIGTQLGAVKSSFSRRSCQDVRNTQSEEKELTHSSSEFQAELIKTHAAPTKERDNLLGVDGMDLDEFLNSLLTNGNNENVEDEFHSLSDEDIEDDVKFREDGVC
ncbi:hypothetical protein YC2023_076933 [Brassica napus]